MLSLTLLTKLFVAFITLIVIICAKDHYFEKPFSRLD